jgi:hypothetical protein
MKLKDIAKQILSEDTWQTNPSAAAPQNPGASPNAVSPAPSPDVKFYNVMNDFNAFTTKIDAEEEAAKKELDASLRKSLLNKQIVVRASKGAVGQAEKDYTITAKNVTITYLKDKYYIIIKAEDKKDYYINTGFKIKVLGEPPAETQETPPATIVEPPEEEQGKKNPASLGEIVKHQILGFVSPTRGR